MLYIDSIKDAVIVSSYNSLAYDHRLYIHTKDEAIIEIGRNLQFATKKWEEAEARERALQVELKELKGSKISWRKRLFNGL